MVAIKREEARAPRSRPDELGLIGAGSAANAPSAPPSEPPLPAHEPAGASTPRPALRHPASFIAHLVAVDDAGRAWVRWDDDAECSEGSPDAPGSTRSHTQPARSTVGLSSEHVGREVLVCRSGREALPIIVGVLTEPCELQPLGDPSIDLLVERRRVVIAARTEVVLRCGQGSITLSADGKVTLRGVDIVSSATRTQRIRGGAVRIN